ncbi:sensor histidine kinase [Niastella populi]|uniref:histidine kinase n=1 Tax=Niastella populi TaxID=550983 RepID=A0A1V9GDG5_9BACT|nr:ATP-binding protein [Niastella populi]OQP68663.1 PAS domain-containing sensor histidine kinase [Niastella populi]
MHDIAKVTLQNEMDLILAHKRSMRLAELAGLSLSAQTTFATAVSEVARTCLESGKVSYLILCVNTDQRDKFIVACLKNEQLNSNRSREGLEHAKKLVNKYNIFTSGTETAIELFYYIAPHFRVDLEKINEWRQLFRNEPSISPYEELKRKNEQLQDLSEKIQKSEAHYKTLTNSLPLTIFSLDVEGKLLYANEWLERYTGHTIDYLNNSQWKTIIHEEEYATFAVLLNKVITQGTATIKTQARLKNKQGDYIWHQVSLSPFRNEQGDLQYWIGFIVDIHAQKVVEETLKDNIELKNTQAKLKENQRTLEKYVDELNRSNLELQQFAFVASHDLQEPVRKLLFYSDYMVSNYSGVIDEKGLGFLSSMRSASHRMRNLIQDLLLFSQINKERLNFTDVNLNEIAQEACQDLEIAIEEKKAVINMSGFPVIAGDASMLRQLFENIIANAIKYSRPTQAPVVDITCKQNAGFVEIAFKDNGIGFDEKYIPQMFRLFQRLHDRTAVEGTGLGLAICRKIVEMHHGTIWANGQEGEGATFFVSLPLNTPGN